jgi:hypothetical protein
MLETSANSTMLTYEIANPDAGNIATRRQLRRRDLNI